MICPLEEANLRLSLVPFGAITMMLTATDALVRLFSNDSRLLRLARDIGIAAVDRAPPLKRVFMRQAMGLGVLPGLG